MRSNGITNSKINRFIINSASRTYLEDGQFLAPVVQSKPVSQAANPKQVGQKKGSKIVKKPEVNTNVAKIVDPEDLEEKLRQVPELELELGNYESIHFQYRFL